MLNKSSLGPVILNLAKATEGNSMLQNVNLSEFAVVDNPSTNQRMIAFTVKEFPEYYFWASTTLFTLLNDNIENAEYNAETRCYYFPDDNINITHMGTVPVKSDPTKHCNVWKIIC